MNFGDVPIWFVGVFRLATVLQIRRRVGDEQLLNSPTLPNTCIFMDIWIERNENLHQHYKSLTNDNSLKGAKLTDEFEVPTNKSGLIRSKI